MAKWLNPNDAVDTRGWGDFDIIKDQGLNHKTTVMPQGTFPTISPVALEPISLVISDDTSYVVISSMAE
ncbi:hypothetical protein FF1_000185 [Malus domestica]